MKFGTQQFVNNLVNLTCIFFLEKALSPNKTNELEVLPGPISTSFSIEINDTFISFLRSQ